MAPGSLFQVHAFQWPRFRAVSITTPICRTPVDYFQNRGVGYAQPLSGQGLKVSFWQNSEIGLATAHGRFRIAAFDRSVFNTYIACNRPLGFRAGQPSFAQDS